MTKRRSRRKRSKRRRERRRQRGPARLMVSGPVSSTAQAVMAQLANGPAFTKDDFIYILQGCAILHQEPEFVNLYLAPRPTLEAAARHFPRFQRRFKRALDQGADELPVIYDNYRIAVLDDLDTPEFRSQLRYRLERASSRLLAGHDAARIELILCLEAWLNDESRQGPGTLPLGVYGLLVAIYEESFDRAMMELPDARDLVGADLYEFWCARHAQADLDTIAAAVDQSASFDQLAERVKTDTALALAWERQETHLIKDLRLRLSQGNLIAGPDLFTADEAALCMRKMEQQYWNRPWSPSRHITALAVLNFVQCMREAVDEIMTPQRTAAFIQRLQSDGQGCLEAEAERLRAVVPHILATIRSLQRVGRPSQNQVVMVLYLLACAKVWSTFDDLDPRWQRFFKRMRKSRLAHEVAEVVRPGAVELTQRDDLS